MLRLKAALLIRIISRQGRYARSEREKEKEVDRPRAIIVFKRHYEIALANEMRGYVRVCAQIEIYWKIENTFSRSAVPPRSSCPGNRSDVRIVAALHRRVVSPTRCIGLHESRDGCAHAITPGRRFGKTRARGIVSPGVKITSIFARTPCYLPPTTCRNNPLKLKGRNLKLYF